MVFSSTVFLCGFLPAVLLVYYLCPHCIRNLFLLAASLMFYAWGEPKYILVMLFTILFDFGAGLLMERVEERGRMSKLILSITIAVNLAMLCFFKYTDFAIETINALLGTGLSFMRLALPIGISFYTFQTLSYVIDVYRRQVRAQHNVIDFAMYVTMFPQLIAGPIVRYSDIQDQLSDRRISPAKFSEGVFRFIIGLGKKVLLANQIGLLWDEIYALGGEVSASTAWLGAISFTFQIYFDFSGYSDMAVGIGRMLGFDFPENFRYPYESKSITEFWRRWHVTLGTWFREYLYIPLGSNRRGKSRQIFNLLVVWLLTGLWHGAGWNFVLWGLYFFVILAAEKLFLLKLLDRCPGWLQHLYSLLLIVMGWVLFACDDMKLLLPYIGSLFGKGGFVSSMSMYYLSSYWVILIIMAVGSTSLPARWAKTLMERLKLGEGAVLFIRTLFSFAVLILSVAFLVGDTYNPFLYFRF